MCPSPPPFGIGLGPTNPWLITIAKETLIFRRQGLSPCLRLLVPAFSLPYAPGRVSSPLHRRTERSPTTRILRYESAVSVLCLSPDHLRRRNSRRVSCYAFFKGWLLLSQPPDCRRILTSSSCTEHIFRDLNWRSGLFPF